MTTPQPDASIPAADISASTPERTPVPAPPSPHALGAETAELTGPRTQPSGRTERLFGLRRHESVRRGPAGDATAGQDAVSWNPARFEAGPWTIGLDGRPTGAAATIMMDNATAVAVHHAAAGELEAVVTTELQVNVLRPLPGFDPSADADPADAPQLECWYAPLHGDALGGAARAWLVDEAGVRHVEATGWFQAVPAATPAALDAFVAHSRLPVDASTRVPMASLLGVDESTVPEADPAARPQVDPAPRPGLRFADGSALANPQGSMHGGAMTLRAVLAAQAAMPDREKYDVQAIRTIFTRPGHGEMVAMTRVRHAGRSLRLVDVDLVRLDEAGEPVAEKPMVQVQVTFRAAQG